MMEWWQTLLISLGGCVGTGFLTMLLGKAGLFEQLSKKRKQEKEDDLVEKISNVIDEKIKPIRKDIEDFKKHQEVNTASLVVMTRCHLKDDKDEFERKGFATPNEKASWKEMLNVYKKNGGNHFKEYVNQWERTVEALPDYPTKKRKRSLASAAAKRQKKVKEEK